MIIDRKEAIVIVNSRAESSRIPRKFERRIAGRPAIEHILKRLEKTGLDVVLAVPHGEAADYQPYIKGPKNYIFEGNPDSPLHRMARAVRWYGSMKGYQPDYVVRVTNDDILVDAQTILQLIDGAREAGADYAITPNIIRGADAEVISTGNLLKAADTYEQAIEHVSYFVRGGKILLSSARAEVARPYRMTMDFPEDVIVLENVLRECGGPDAPLENICYYLDRHNYVQKFNELPEITIYTCARNAEKYILRTMLSVMDAHANMEYIVIEDGSTDQTLGEILQYASIKKDTRFRVVVNESNLGLSSSCNIALSMARGRYIMRVDADDLLLPGACENMLKRINEIGAGVLYSNYSEINDQGIITKPNIPGSLHHHAGCALMDKRLLDEVRFTEGLRHWDSLDLWKRFSKTGLPVAYYDDVPLWLYRQHPASLSKSEPEVRAQKKRELEKS